MADKMSVNSLQSVVEVKLSNPPEDCLPNLSIDNIVLGIENGRLMVLVAKFKEGMAQGKWGLLGGWVKTSEDLDTAAKRNLKYITGIEELFLEQFRAFGRTDRYSLKRVVTIGYYALVKPELYHFLPSGRVAELQWMEARKIKELIYDHYEILNCALEHLQYKIRHEPIGFNLLPEKFTLLQLQELYEVILDTKLDKPNFRRKFKKMNLIVDCHEKQRDVNHRAANLYRFDLGVYQQLCQKGFSFEF